jgi:hypothetical protein
METPAPFDLNQAIASWREQLQQTSAVDGGSLAELEAHLRESIANLEASSLSQEEAFLIASRRLGNSDALKTEFHKLNPMAVWTDRGLWTLIGLQLWIAISHATIFMIPLWKAADVATRSYFENGTAPAWLLAALWSGANTFPTLIAIGLLVWMLRRLKPDTQDRLTALVSQPTDLFIRLVTVNLVCLIPSSTFWLWGQDTALQGSTVAALVTKLAFDSLQLLLLAAATFVLARWRQLKPA